MCKRENEGNIRGSSGKEDLIEIIISDVNDILKRRIDNRATIEDLCEACSRRGDRWHLAVVSKNYLGKMIAGQKKIESRFNKVRVAPFRQVASGDILFLKEVGGPIRAIATVANAEFFGPLERGVAKKIMEMYQSGLSLEDRFKREKENSSYVTLIHLGQVMPIRPITLRKYDRRPWVVLWGRIVSGGDWQLRMF